MGKVIRGDTVYDVEKIKVLNLIFKTIKNIQTSIPQQIQQSINELIDGAPATLDTLKEIDDYITNLSTGTISKKTTIPQGGFLPNTFYNLGELSGTVNFDLAPIVDNDIMNEYMIQFSTGAVPPTITWSANITNWYGGNAPTINANKIYQISILEGIGVYIEI